MEVHRSLRKSFLQKRAFKQIVNVARLESLKRRRSKLVSRRHRLRMLQHDLYDVLVKLHTLLSGELKAPSEETASRSGLFAPPQCMPATHRPIAMITLSSLVLMMQLLHGMGCQAAATLS